MYFTVSTSTLSWNQQSKFYLHSFILIIINTAHHSCRNYSLHMQCSPWSVTPPKFHLQQTVERIRRFQAELQVQLLSDPNEAPSDRWTVIMNNDLSLIPAFKSDCSWYLSSSRNVRIYFFWRFYSDSTTPSLHCYSSWAKQDGHPLCLFIYVLLLLFFAPKDKYDIVTGWNPQVFIAHFLFVNFLPLLPDSQTVKVV